MNSNEYHDFVRGTSKPKTNDLKYIYPCLGLAGECGEVIEHIKKYARGDFAIDDEHRRKLLDELGDVRWYYTRLLNDLGYTDQEVIDFNVAKLEDRRKNGKRPVG